MKPRVSVKFTAEDTHAGRILASISKYCAQLVARELSQFCNKNTAEYCAFLKALSPVDQFNKPG